ncbi:MAG: ABC transporter permease [Janthinobacterium lividum]
MREHVGSVGGTVALEVVPAAGRRTTRPSARLTGAIWTGLLLLILAFLVIYPVAMLVVGALTGGDPVVDGYRLETLSLDRFWAVLSNDNVHLALFNSMTTCLGGTALAVLIGLAFAWIVVRTDTPAKRVIAAAGLLPLFVPPLVGGVAWAILGSPKTGLINMVLAKSGLDFRVNLYSTEGIIFVFGMYYAPYVYMFTASALKNMDPSLEEAAEMSGASSLRTMLTVTFPLILPAIVSGMLLSFVVMLGIYGIPAVLGTPANIPVLTTYIYTLTNWSPPLYGQAASVAILLMAVTGVLVVLQNKVLSGRNYTTVAGKAFRPRALRLGPWRWVTLGLAVIYLMIVVVLPTLALMVAGFRKFLFVRDLPSLFDLKQYSTVHFDRLFSNPQTVTALVNTLKVGLIAAVVGGVLAFAIGYTVTRSRAPGRSLVDAIATVPVAIPGLVIGVAYLWAWIGLPGGLYGTLWILALAFIARFIPDTVKALSTSLMQIHRELEEAAWICGRSMLSTIVTVVLPLARPGVAAAMTLLFILSTRELGSSLFLYSSGSMVMSVQLLNYYEGGNLSITAAYSLVQVILLGLVIGIGNLLSRGSRLDRAPST